MDVAIVGLGRMGMGMGARLAKAGHKVAGYDVNPGKRSEAAGQGIAWLDSLAMLPNVLAGPRVVIISVPAGPPVDSAIDGIVPVLSAGDIVIDGGNSFYKDSVARAKQLSDAGLSFLDAGVSGGIWGNAEGYCIMVGGAREAFDRAEPVFRDLAQEGGYSYVGESGAGHFSKMVHNGIEYAMLQAYGEGFEILKESPYPYDLHELSRLWNRGSVVRSWLLELAELAFADSADLEHVKGWVEDSGEGRWTVIQAIEERVPAPVIALSLMMRFRSRQEDSFSAKVIAALRNKFGGHEVKPE
jgi:6-phosphogluconate dehydrogenase